MTLDDAWLAYGATKGEPPEVQRKAREAYDVLQRAQEKRHKFDVVLGTADRVEAANRPPSKPVKRDAWGYRVDG